METRYARKSLGSQKVPTLLGALIEWKRVGDFEEEFTNRSYFVRSIN